MPYVLDKNDNHIFDKDGNKIEFSISYLNTNDWYKHKEPLHINDDDHFDTEDRYLIVKDAIQDNHAVNKRQLDQLKQDIDNKLLALQNSINASINSLKSQISELRNLNFRNDKINNQMPPNFNGNH